MMIILLVFINVLHWERCVHFNNQSVNQRKQITSNLNLFCIIYRFRWKWYRKTDFSVGFSTYAQSNKATTKEEEKTNMTMHRKIVSLTDTVCVVYTINNELHRKWFASSCISYACIMYSIGGGMSYMEQEWAAKIKISITWELWCSFLPAAAASSTNGIHSLFLYRSIHNMFRINITSDSLQILSKQVQCKHNESTKAKCTIECNSGEYIYICIRFAHWLSSNSV